jgi:hypothetical protein
LVDEDEVEVPEGVLLLVVVVTGLGDSEGFSEGVGSWEGVGS